MCYGMNCPYERTAGDPDSVGECRIAMQSPKPADAACSEENAKTENDYNGE